MPLHGSGRMTFKHHRAPRRLSKYDANMWRVFVKSFYDAIVVKIGFGASSLARGLRLKKEVLKSQKIDAW